MVWPDFVQDRLRFLVKKKYIREVGKKGAKKRRSSFSRPVPGRSGRLDWLDSWLDSSPFFALLVSAQPPGAAPPAVQRRRSPAIARVESPTALGFTVSQRTKPALRRPLGAAATACGSSRLAASKQQWTIGLLGQAVT